MKFCKYIFQNNKALSAAALRQGWRRPNGRGNEWQLLLHDDLRSATLVLSVSLVYKEPCPDFIQILQLMDQCDYNYYLFI